MSENVLLVSEAAEPGDDGPDLVLITRSGGEAVDVGKWNVTRDLQVLTENRLDTSLQDIPKKRDYSHSLLKAVITRCVVDKILFLLFFPLLVTTRKITLVAIPAKFRLGFHLTF